MTSSPPPIGSRLWVSLGAILGGLAVACGAFAAHGLDGYFRVKYAGMAYEKKLSNAQDPEIVERIPLPQKYLADFDTGARYQMYHALALIALGLLPRSRRPFCANLAGVLFVLGIAGFSGGLYLYTLLHQRWIGMTIVPLGGVLFLAGWGAMAWAVLQNDKA